MVSRGPLTIGQQALRLTASAAVCGLSFSFILSSSINSNVDQILLGNSFSPVKIEIFRPLTVLKEFPFKSPWQVPLLAQDSLSSIASSPQSLDTVWPPSSSPPQIKKSETVAKRHVARQASRRSLVTAVAKQVKPLHRKQVTLPAQQPARDINALLPPVVIRIDHETVVSQKVLGPEFPELNELLMSERYAYQKLQLRVRALATSNNPSPAQSAMEPTLDYVNTQSILMAKEEEVTPPVEEKVQVPADGVKGGVDIQTLLTRTSDKGWAESLQPAPFKAPADLTVIDLSHLSATKTIRHAAEAPYKREMRSVTTQGQAPPRPIEEGLVAPAELSGSLKGEISRYPGHFEVALYNKVDEYGYPVGYPVAWQSLPEGSRSFRLSVEALTNQNAYLFAQYIRSGSKDASSSNSWIAYPKNPIRVPANSVANIEIPLPGASATVASDTVVSVAASVGPLAATDQGFLYVGRVVTMFMEQQNRGLAGALIRIRGTKQETTSSSDGTFSLKLPQTKGEYLLEISRPGYMPSIFSIQARSENNNRTFELASRASIERAALGVGIRQSVYESVLMIKVHNYRGEGMPGFTGQLGIKADGPYYFSKDGLPTRDGSIRATGFDGRMIFFNVESGVGAFDSWLAASEAMAPVTINAIQGGEMIYHELEPFMGRVEGRLFDASSKDSDGRASLALKGARVRAEGSSEWVTSDALGNFSLPQMRYYKNYPLQIEVNHEKYYAHSFRLMAPGEGARKNLFLFSQLYTNRLAQKAEVEFDPYAGMIIGMTGVSARLRIDALADHSMNNKSQDFYFDKTGDLRSFHSFSDESYGTFVIFNVPRGRTMLHGYDGDARLRFSRVLNTSPSTISVLVP